ncbi:hypothetical protein [Jeotgalicoccus psychrophilus]|uniref:hypothetical protein n=1 Tax=Jeotgalicoccus psychrophilus TaxID=157228 RepID=UPI00047984B6|nr:hypothetical protein [Jeotgalicoccus psychrophilus]
MKKLLLLLSFLNLIYVFITMASDELDNIFLVPFGFPLLTTTVLFILSVVSFIFDENGTSKRTLSILSTIINLLPILFVASMFIFL